MKHFYLCLLKLFNFIIIIMLRYQHGYPWPSLTTPLCHPLLPAGLQGYILYRHRAAVCKFELVVMPLLVHVKGSTGVHHLWDGAGWHLIPYGISPRSEFSSQAYKNWHITWGINLEPDWPPLAKGFQISHYHTPTRPLNFFPLDNRRIRAYRS